MNEVGGLKMSNLFVIIGGIFLGLIAFTLYACLVVGARADRQMEAMMEAERQKAEAAKIK